MKKIERTYVSSSNLRSVGYDSKNNILEIEFNNGHVYQYYHVPYSLYSGLMNANSHGIYFSHNIRDKYVTRKII